MVYLKVGFSYLIEDNVKQSKLVKLDKIDKSDEIGSGDDCEQIEMIENIDDVIQFKNNDRFVMMIKT